MLPTYDTPATTPAWPNRAAAITLQILPADNSSSMSPTKSIDAVDDTLLPVRLIDPTVAIEKLGQYVQF